VLSEARQILGDLFFNTARYVSGRFPTSHDILVRKFIESLLDGTAPPVSAEEGRETVRVTKMIADCIELQSEQRIRA
jgi:hypothetical protein